MGKKSRCKAHSPRTGPLHEAPVTGRDAPTLIPDPEWADPTPSPDPTRYRAFDFPKAYIDDMLADKGTWAGQADPVVARPARQLVPGRRPRHREDAARVAGKRPELAAGRRVPQDDPVVGRPARQHVPGRRPSFTASIPTQLRTKGPSPYLFFKEEGVTHCREGREGRGRAAAPPPAP